MRMKAALLNGFIGSWLTLWIARGMYDFEISEAILCISISNLAGLVALVSTLQIERSLESLKGWLNRSFVTWTLLVVFYFTILLSLAPLLRNPVILISLLFPLVLSTGFAMILFGPIQDYLVRRQQIRKSLASH